MKWKNAFLVYFIFINFVLVGQEFETLPDLDKLTHVECTIRPSTDKELMGRRRKALPGCKKINKKIFPIHVPHQKVSQATQSNNWSGYYGASNLASPQNGSVTQVAAQWNVPSVTGSTLDTYSSMWVGFDGLLNGSGTVEQIGTEQNWSSGAPAVYAWYEMFPSSLFIIEFPAGKEVAVGDVVGAHVVYLGNNVYDLLFANYTKGIKTTIPHSSTTTSKGLRNSVEWVIEAPSDSCGILPLAEFYTNTPATPTASMSNCNAVINGVHALIGNTSWQHDSITMVTTWGAIKAVPSSLVPDQGSFFVTWHGN